jgi:GNAT superfamily N-acetyltransferase
VPIAARIRPRLAGDLGACVRLLRQVHEQDGYPTVWPADPAGWLSPHRQVAAWVADQAGVISGHVALTRVHAGPAATAWAGELNVPVGDLRCVSLLFTGPEARGHGLGGRLLDSVLSAIRAGGRAATLEVVSLNRAAVHLYRAWGWREVGSVSYDWLPEHARALLFVPPDPGS